MRCLGLEQSTDSPPTSQANPRSTAILAVAKANNLQLEVVETDTSKPTAEYLKYNKLSKVPTFVGSDGYVLSECIAIAIYGMFHGFELPRQASPLRSVMI